MSKSMKKLQPIVMLLAALAISACGPQASPTPPDDAHVATKCVSVATSKPDNVQLAGRLVLQDFKNASSLYLFDPGDNSITPLSTPDETVGQASVSPDQKTLAFQAGNSKTNGWDVVLTDAQGKRLADIPWKQGFFSLGNWINNKQILIASFPPLVVFNPYTGEQLGYNYADLPNYSLDTTSNRLASFDPSMTRVLYKSQDDRDVLLDFTSKKALAELDNHPDPMPIATWKADGTEVAVVGTVAAPPIGGTPSANTGHEIFGISHDGKIRQLTYLTVHYGQLLTISPSGLSWSPDGRYLAFWIIYPASPALNWQLAVYDNVTQKTTNYCIANTSASTRPLTVPVWSPDGRQLLVENRYTQDSNHLVVLDIDQQAAFQIRDNTYPLGWLAP